MALFGEARRGPRRASGRQHGLRTSAAAAGTATRNRQTITATGIVVLSFQSRIGVSMTLDHTCHDSRWYRALHAFIVKQKLHKGNPRRLEFPTRWLARVNRIQGNLR
jgi:hypothetical protein